MKFDCYVLMRRLLRQQIMWSVGTRSYPRQSSATTAVEPFSSSSSLFSLSLFFFLIGTTTELVYRVRRHCTVLLIQNDQIMKAVCLFEVLIF